MHGMKLRIQLQKFWWFESKKHLKMLSKLLEQSYSQENPDNYAFLNENMMKIVSEV